MKAYGCDECCAGFRVEIISLPRAMGAQLGCDPSDESYREKYNSFLESILEDLRCPVCGEACVLEEE